jgi:hypothetical protein
MSSGEIINKILNGARVPAKTGVPLRMSVERITN